VSGKRSRAPSILDASGRPFTQGLYAAPTPAERDELFDLFDRLDPRAQHALLRFARVLKDEIDAAAR